MDAVSVPIVFKIVLRKGEKSAIKLSIRFVRNGVIDVKLYVAKGIISVYVAQQMWRNRSGKYSYKSAQNCFFFMEELKQMVWCVCFFFHCIQFMNAFNSKFNWNEISSIARKRYWTEVMSGTRREWTKLLASQRLFSINAIFDSFSFTRLEPGQIISTQNRCVVTNFINWLRIYSNLWRCLQVFHQLFAMYSHQRQQQQQSQ